MLDQPEMGRASGELQCASISQLQKADRSPWQGGQSAPQLGGVCRTLVGAGFAGICGVKNCLHSDPARVRMCLGSRRAC